MKPGRTGITRIFYASIYSWQGLKAAWIYEAAFRQELILGSGLAILSFFLPVSMLEQLFLLSCIVLVWLAELMNSAIEAVVDRIGSEQHVLSGRAKDIGSAAVGVTIIWLIIVWACILIPKFIA